MKIIIIGGGEVGLELANMLSEEHKITIIESDGELAKKIANKTSALVVKGDGTDLSTLKEAGIEGADTLVVTTDDDKTNLMICELAKTEKIKKIISLINSPKNGDLFTKLGISSIIQVVETTVLAIKRALFEYGDEKIIALLGGGELQIIQQIVSKDSKLVGKKPEIKNAVIASITRNEEILMPKNDIVLKEGDILIVSVKTKDLSGVVNQIAGK